MFFWAAWGTCISLPVPHASFFLKGAWWVYGISWNFKERLKAQSLGGRQRQMAAISKMNSERSGCCERLPVPFSQRKLESASTFPVSLLPPPDTVRHKTYSSYNHISDNSLTRQTITLHFLKCGNISVRYMKPLRGFKKGGSTVWSLRQTPSQGGHSSGLINSDWCANGFPGQQTNKKKSPITNTFKAFVQRHRRNTRTLPLQLVARCFIKVIILKCCAPNCLYMKSWIA